MTPPRISTWFLTHFSCAHDTESLLGDLSEELSRGRSRNWYRQQVLVAIVASAWTTIASHKLLTIRAVLVGWTALVASIWGVLWLRVEIDILYLHWGGPAWITTIGMILTWLLFPVSGWTVARLHRPHGRAMLFAYTTSVWILASVFAVSATVTFARRLHAPIEPFFLLLNALKNSALFSIFVLLGGLWVRQPVVATDVQTSAE